MSLAFWCVLIAALLPYVAFAFVRGLDGRHPRAAVSALTGRAARAYAAHLNAFEAFPPFLAAVTVSHFALGRNGVTDALAVAFILVRAAHIAFYVGDRPPLRSAMFSLGLLIVVAMFIHAAMG